MWRPVDENRPKCRWPDHQWDLVSYHVVVGLGQHGTVFTLSECLKCGRLRTDELVQESAND